MHSTDNLDDGYLGSGKYLRRSLNKHGVQNHSKEILEYLPDRISLKEKEKQLVNEQLVHDKLCMNLKPGGYGGLCNKQHLKKFIEGSSIYMKNKWKEEEYRNKRIIFSSLNMKQTHKLGKFKYGNFIGKHHTEETKLKMSLSQQGKQNGEKNSQFGTCWITNNKENKKIKKEDINIYTECGWILGRKLNTT
jgi:hypothetical protein